MAGEVFQMSTLTRMGANSPDSSPSVLDASARKTSETASTVHAVLDHLHRSSGRLPFGQIPQNAHGSLDRGAPRIPAIDADEIPKVTGGRK